MKQDKTIREESGDILYFKKHIKCEGCKIVKPVGDFYKKYYEGELHRMATYALCDKCRKLIRAPSGPMKFTAPMDKTFGRNYIALLESQTK